jgi:hypothetical protein
MKYVLLFASDPNADLSEWSDHRQEAVMGEIMAWWEQHASAGVILGGERLQPSVTSTTFRRSGDGNVVMTDGPFVEANEEVGGYAVIEVADLDAALAIATTWPALQMPTESVEVRPVMEM